jgi:serine/threonine protein kinase
MPTSLPPETDRSLLERIDASVDRFEALLKSGEHPQIESFFEGWHDTELSNLLRELLGVELEHRVRRGEKPALVEYHNRFPRYRDVIDEEFPARLGNYDLLELVGLGAFGRVYRGQLRGTNICHAVKILHDGASSAEFDSVAREFQALAKIKHPSIVTAHNLDIGVGGAPAFLAMEYVEGKSLQELLRSARLPVERVVQVVSEIAQALGAAHVAGIIHRDLKPANVLIDPEWHPHLTDFGLALLNVQRHDRTEELAGTLVYISPEQIRGEVCDPRSDIWSLGVIFYEMLTGETPFHGTTRKVLFEQIQSAEPTEPRVLRPDLSPKLQQICLRCLEKDRTRRWSTAYDLAAALRESPKTHEQPRTNRQFIFLILAAVAVIATVVWLYVSRANVPRKSDSDIFLAIESDLVSDPTLQYSNIRITVRNAVVTLTGDVRQDSDRMRAAAIAGQEEGVRQVTNNLRVVPLSPATRSPGQFPLAPKSSSEENPQSSVGESSANKMILLPSNWTSVNALQLVGDEIFLGGNGNYGGTFGKYHIGSGIFSDLSYLLPKPWCPVSALAYGANQLFIGGGSREGCAALFSPASGSFQDITPQLRSQSSDLYYYGGVGAVSFNGREFLVGGSGKRTSLELYSTETGRFTYLAVGPYFAVNTIASDGNSFLIAGAGPGPGPQQPPAVGWISPAHTFTSLTGALPRNWGTTRRSAYDGKDFLIAGVDGISGTNQVLALITPIRTTTEVTNSFPTALNLHAIDGHDGHFLIAGQLEQKAYLARYGAGTQLITLTGLLPEGASDVTAVKIVGDKAVAAAVSRTGRLFLVSVPY